MAYQDRPHRAGKDSRRPTPYKGKSNQSGNTKKSGDKPFKKFDREGGNQGRPFKKFDGDKPFKKFDREGGNQDRPFKKFDGDKPFKKFDREGGNQDRPFKKFDSDKPFKKFDREGGNQDRPFKKFDGDKPFKKFDREGGNQGRPFKKFDGDKPFKKFDREGGNQGRPFKKFDGDKPFKKFDREGGNQGRPFKKFDGDKPFKKFDREGGNQGRPFKKFDGDKPFKKFDREGGNQGRPFKKFDGDKPFKKFDGDTENTHHKTSRNDFVEKRDRLNRNNPDWKRPDYESAERERQARKRVSKFHKAQEETIKEPDTIRLNKYIANAGVCSRREADALISSGEITVNGEVVTEMGHKVQSGDVVMHKGKLLRPERYIYVLLNKPKDYITTTDDPQARQTVMELVHNVGDERIYPVGRLDRSTTGLLLLTNDGELAQKLAHPSFQIPKVYEVELDKPITKAHFEQLVQGVELEDGLAVADQASLLNPERTQLGVEIHLGRNRIIRRMFEALGYEVVKLDRTLYAGLTKKDLPRGNWRHLTPQEVIKLKYLL